MPQLENKGGIWPPHLRCKVRQRNCKILTPRWDQVLREKAKRRYRIQGFQHGNQVSNSLPNSKKVLGQLSFLSKDIPLLQSRTLSRRSCRRDEIPRHRTRATKANAAPSPATIWEELSEPWTYLTLIRTQRAYFYRKGVIIHIIRRKLLRMTAIVNTQVIKIMYNYRKTVKMPRKTGVNSNRV